jgi:aerobic-type carbon monoxide dehydrogenase small subunit (CoxS/CutS family)
MANISLKVNGQSRVVATDPTTLLLYVLRNDLDLHVHVSAAVWRSAELAL